MARKPKGNHRVYKGWAPSVNLHSTKYETLIESEKMYLIHLQMPQIKNG